MRMFVAVGCLLPFALAAQASISRTSPEAAVVAAYAQDSALHRRGDPVGREGLLSRSLERIVGADEARVPRDLLGDGAPHLVDLRIATVSEKGGAAEVLADFARGDGAREHVTYTLVFERNAWRIDDIGYSPLGEQTHTLRDLIAR